MAWWALSAVQAGSSFLSNTMQGSAADSLAKSKNTALQNQLGQQINQLMLQRTAERQATSASLFNIDVAKDTAASQVALQAAASGTIGASVQDAVSTVNTIADSQVAAVKSAQAAQEESILQQVKSATYNAGQGMTSESSVTAGLGKWGLDAATGFTKSYLSRNGDISSLFDSFSKQLGL